MGFIGKQKLGFVVRIKGGFVGAWRRGLVQRHKLYACPAGGAFLPRKVAKEFLRDKIVIAFGVAEFYKRYSFVRLPGVGLLFCEEK